MSYRLYLDFKTTIKTIEDLTTIVNHLTEVNHNYQLSLTNDYLIDRIRQTNPSNPPLIRVLEAIKHHSLDLYYWPTYQLLGIINHLGLTFDASPNQPFKLTVDFGVTEPTNQSLIDCQKFANQLKEKSLL